MTKTMKGKFLVIGGQYNFIFYGLKSTERSAKILSTKNAEYWDNWQGWHKPAIYELVEEIELPSNADIDDVTTSLQERVKKLGYKNIFSLREIFDTEVLYINRLKVLQDSFKKS